MSITFSLNVARKADAKPAIVSARQLAAFRAFARQRGELVDTGDEDAILAYSFEARVCPWPLASICALFDHDQKVISVIEEAQFRRLNVTFWRDDATRSISVGVASTPDGAGEMNLCNQNAYAVLETMGLGEESCGDIPLADLNARLRDPEVRKAMNAGGLRSYLKRLDAISAIDTIADDVRMVWG